MELKELENLKRYETGDFLMRRIGDIDNMIQEMNKDSTRYVDITLAGCMHSGVRSIGRGHFKYLIEAFEKMKDELMKEFEKL